MKKLGLVLGGLVLAACASTAVVDSALSQSLANQLFGAASRGTSEPAQTYGSYARGCADGLVQLPETGPTWQAMRLSRNRNWGHPQMIDFLEGLSRQAVQIGWRGLYVGDISQPRGGPMTSGHASHQMGLDADIWMLPPESLTLSRGERENISSVSVRTEDQRGLTSHWTPRHAALLRAAASDPRVDRVFVAAAVKIEMCRTATPEDTAWLQRIRPIAGHNYHFHVRLRCPAGSPHCETQSPTVAELSNGGNGCDDSLRWWVTDYLNPPRTTGRPAQPTEPAPPRRRHPREFIMADLPRQCSEVVQR
ncbi:penicillin-insensitive murein endopeptidase [Pararhodobacter zhoushanensis]|uniref:Penicillin-insensitive murein endopeptidase n=1 Tax=Pararhodobacter zhoushanensis TaxID=2479545 RepID=A0ABT3GVB5_9RHOB|nr:penicillin-insensitive murein endopeptidase [Pararhodobacter zhoushanensis]MCW1931471.1 penicillin-insensitive murein endopeptidase [Pararhodobacter zhoushanensis]